MKTDPGRARPLSTFDVIFARQLRVTASQESLEALDRLAKLPILTIDLKYVCSKTIRVDYIFTFGINKGKIKRTYAGRYIETDTAD